MAFLLINLGIFLLLLPLSTLAADIQLSWQGCEPLCAVYTNNVQVAQTEKKTHVIKNLDGRKCYVHKICSIVNNQPDQCLELKLKGSSKLVGCK
jgi:hypothetical protein